MIFKQCYILEQILENFESNLYILKFFNIILNITIIGKFVKRIFETLEV